MVWRYSLPSWPKYFFSSADHSTYLYKKIWYSNVKLSSVGILHCNCLSSMKNFWDKTSFLIFLDILVQKTPHLFNQDSIFVGIIIINCFRIFNYYLDYMNDWHKGKNLPHVKLTFSLPLQLAMKIYNFLFIKGKKGIKILSKPN